MKAVEGGMPAIAPYALQVMALDVAKVVGEQGASKQSRHPPSSTRRGTPPSARVCDAFEILREMYA